LFANLLESDARSVETGHLGSAIRRRLPDLLETAAPILELEACLPENVDPTGTVEFQQLSGYAAINAKAVHLSGGRRAPEHNLRRRAAHIASSFRGDGTKNH